MYVVLKKPQQPPIITEKLFEQIIFVRLINLINNNTSLRMQSKFEILLKDRLSKHFPEEAIEKILKNLASEIKADISSSSLDDLERLAKQKLNITE